MPNYLEYFSIFYFTIWAILPGYLFDFESRLFRTVVCQQLFINWIWNYCGHYSWIWFLHLVQGISRKLTISFHRLSYDLVPTYLSYIIACTYVCPTNIYSYVNVVRPIPNYSCIVIFIQGLFALVFCLCVVPNCVGIVSSHGLVFFSFCSHLSWGGGTLHVPIVT